MYSIGEKIVYPMHGAGTIKAIEEKEILGAMQQYYLLEVCGSDEIYLVPVSTADTIGVRPIIEKTQVSGVYTFLAEYKEEDDNNWNKRHRENLKRLRIGTTDEVAKVVSSLTLREKGRPLSTSEKKLLNNALNILSSEIALAEDTERAKIKEKINDLIFA